MREAAALQIQVQQAELQVVQDMIAAAMEHFAQRHVGVQSHPIAQNSGGTSSGGTTGNLMPYSGGAFNWMLVNPLFES